MVVDKSALRPAFMKLVVNPVYRNLRLPHKLHPNFITVCGLFFSIMPLIIALHVRDFSYVWTFSCFITLYVLCDHLDGMHAKKTDQTSELGAALDHFSDYICGVVNAIALCILTSADELILLIFFVIYFQSFAISHIEQQKSGTLYFGRIGPLEAVFSVAIFYIVASLDDGLIIARDGPSLFSHSFFSIVMIGFLYNLLKCSLRLHRARVEFFKTVISITIMAALFFAFDEKVYILSFCAVLGIVKIAYILFARPFSSESVPLR